MAANASGPVASGCREPSDPTLHDGLHERSAVDLGGRARRGQPHRRLRQLIPLEVQACFNQISEDEPDTVADSMVFGPSPTQPSGEPFGSHQIPLQEQDPLVHGGRADLVDDR